MHKVCWIFLFWIFLCKLVIAQGPELNQLVTVSFEQASPDLALQKIEDASGIPFSYNNNLLPDQKISFSFKEKPLWKVLDKVLGELKLGYSYKNGILIIIPGRKTTRNNFFTVSGYIEDVESGERLIGATVYDARTRKGTITNEFGFFSLRLQKDSIVLVASMVGYAVHAEKMFLNEDHKGFIHLKTDLSLETVEINDDQYQVKSELGGMGAVQVPISDLKKLPSLMGETDVLASLSLLPGVHSGGDGSSGMYVRGGGPDQNLILYDGVPIYNSSHLFGFYSIFNSDVIKDIQLVKGGFPARYGGRLSSVVNIRMKEGNLKKIKGEGNLGLTSVRMMLEGPLIKDKLSFVLSARRTILEPYLVVINKFARLRSGNTLGYSFFDLNAKVSWQISERDGLFLSMYNGGDVFSSGYLIKTNSVTDAFDFDLKWGNSAGVVRWHRDWTKNLFSDFSFYGTQYRYNSTSSTEVDFLNQGKESNQLTNRSSVRDLGARMSFDWIPGDRQFIRFGANAIGHQFTPEVFQQTQTSSVGTIVDTTSQAVLRPLEANAYFEDQVELGDYFSFNLGLHASFYQLDTTQFSSLQPRVSFRLGPVDRWGIYGSFTSMAQYLHLLSNGGVGLPTDLWVPATGKVPPEKALQYSLGLDKTFAKESVQLSVEAYYKSMKNLVDYQTGTNFLGTVDWQDRIEKGGEGESVGLEVFLRKTKGRVRGWVGYTRSATTRQFSSINLGKVYPYKYDRKHDLSATLIFEANDKIEFSANWVLGSGTAVTFPSSVSLGPSILDFWDLNDGNELNVVIEYGPRNSFRLPTYHRLDLNMRYHKQVGWGEIYWNFGLYNAYNRRNPYFLFLRADYSNDPNSPEIKARKMSLLPILPSINFGFKF